MSSIHPKYFGYFDFCDRFMVCDPISKKYSFHANMVFKVWVKFIASSTYSKPKGQKSKTKRFEENQRNMCKKVCFIFVLDSSRKSTFAFDEKQYTTAENLFKTKCLLIFRRPS